MAHNRIVFVSGANRGIGFEFARQCSRRGDFVVAGYRAVGRSAELLKWAGATGNFFAVQVDVTNENDLGRLRDFIAAKFGRLDLLINNAGINLKYSDPLDKLNPSDLMENFRINVVGPFLTTKALHGLLVKGFNPKAVTISSQMGSIEQSSGYATPYRISKAAVNMLTKNQALAYKKDGLLCVALDPGWVKTEMGGPNAPLRPSESVTNMLRVIDNLTAKDNGAFLGHDGHRRPY
jgi:NAD(P)-dependent dehydrogenase (short-subunit alcohol dehydrogenase family)